MAEEVLVVLTTWPDVEKARAAARTFVEETLIACANILPAVESIYRWEGKVETSGEVLMILKTTRDRVDALERRLLTVHPYEVPEFLTLRVTGGLPRYLNWVEQGCLPG
jgi:periplasmic divalent cation tolerance protein